MLSSVQVIKMTLFPTIFMPVVLGWALGFVLFPALVGAGHLDDRDLDRVV